MEALAMSASGTNTFVPKSTTVSISNQESSVKAVQVETKINSSAINQNADDIKKPNSEIMKKVEQKLNDFIKSQDVNVKFAYNEKLNMSYISIIDEVSGREIRKMPSEEAMKISESMKDLVGMMFDKKG